MFKKKFYWGGGFFVVSVFLTFSTIRAQTPSFSAAAKSGKTEIRQNLENTPENKKIRTSIPKTIAEISRALVSTPDDPILYNNLSILYFHAGRHEESLAAMQKAVKLNPSAQFYLNLSVLYDYLDQMPESFTAVRRSIELEPTNIRAREQFCELNLRSAKYEEAAECFKYLTEQMPDNPAFYSHYGIILVYKNDVKKSINYLQKALEIFPGNLMLRNTLGIALFKKKDYREAAAIFESILEDDPKDNSARFNLAVAQTKINKKSEAVKNYFMIKNSDDALAKKLYKIIHGDKILFLEDIKR